MSATVDKAEHASSVIGGSTRPPSAPAAVLAVDCIDGATSPAPVAHGWQNGPRFVSLANDAAALRAAETTA